MRVDGKTANTWLSLNHQLSTLNSPGSASSATRPAVISAWFLALAAAGRHRLAGHSENRPARTFAQLHDPDQLSDAQFAPPSAQHWFGTDLHGRDLFSRVLFGAQISLLVGVVGAVVSLVIGVLWGAVAGYVGGRVDAVLMRIVDVLYSLPSIIFVIVLITTLGAVAQAIAPRPKFSRRWTAPCA